VDRHRDAPDTRRVGHREVVTRLERQLRVDLDLAALVHQEGAIRDAVDAHTIQRAHRSHDRLGMTGVHARDRHVAHYLVRLYTHQVDRAQHRLRIRDRLSHTRERTAGLEQVQAHREAVGGRRLQPRGRHARRLVGHRSSPH
jgi:hypothetical protein